MAKLTRLTGKVFAGSAPLTDLGVFGSAKSGTPTNPTATNTEAQIQATEAYNDGWSSAVVTSRNFPPMEEVNGVLRTISYQNCYLLQEGIPSFDLDTEYSNTSVVKSAGGSGELILYVSLQDNNIGHQPGAEGSETYWTRAIFTGSSPIGVPQFTLNYNLVDAPENCIWLEGQEVAREDYPRLFAIYGTTYGETQDPTNFKLPDCRNRVFWGGETAGYIGAGLPNIYGTFVGNEFCDTAYGTGCFYNIVNFQDSPAKGTGTSNALGFDASRSSSIYGASGTVQPPAIKCRVYTRYQ